MRSPEWFTVWRNPYREVGYRKIYKLEFGPLKLKCLGDLEGKMFIDNYMWKYSILKESGLNIQIWQLLTSVWKLKPWAWIRSQ